MLSVMGLLIPSPSMLCATHVYIPDWWRFTFWRTKLWLLTMIPAVGLEIKGVSYKDRKIMISQCSIILQQKMQFEKFALFASRGEIKSIFELIKKNFLEKLEIVYLCNTFFLLRYVSNFSQLCDVKKEVCSCLKRLFQKVEHRLL